MKRLIQEVVLAWERSLHVKFSSNRDDCCSIISICYDIAMLINTKISRNLSVKHLRAFACIAKCGSFSRAADKLAISQPALTLRVKQFEEIIGVTLLKRTTRSVSLTTQGQEFLPKAEKILQDIDSAVISARTSALKQEQRVHVAMLPSIAIRVWPQVIHNHAEYTHDIQIHDNNAKGVYQQVLKEKVDFGISNIWKHNPSLNYIPFIRDRVGLICHVTHKLAKQIHPQDWGELEGLSFVGMEADTGISQLTKKVDGLPESVNTPNYTVLTIAALVGNIENGTNISALPTLAAPDYLNSSLVYRDLKNPVIYRDLYLITSKNRLISKATQQLIDFLQEEKAKICSTFPNNNVLAMENLA